MQIHSKLEQKLNLRKENNSYRELVQSDRSDLIDFSSNDYLGFSNNTFEYDSLKKGATGSRLITGNYSKIEKLEKSIASFHKAESSLFFNSGYTANLGLFSTLPQRGDRVIYDESIHASIRDGIRLSNANSYSFKHNSALDLERLLAKNTTTSYVVVESVYSMGGDSPNLEEISAVCTQYGAYLIVDEAHSFGLIGSQGKGLINHLNLEEKIFARVVTFGKALGTHGAVILGSESLRNFLINFCRPFIYTTGSSPLEIETISKQYDNLIDSDDRRSILFQNKNLFLSKLNKNIPIITGKYSAIVSIIIGDNNKTKNSASHLQEQGFDIRPILSPTVVSGKECLRICFHSFNTENEVLKLAQLINGNNES